MRAILLLVTACRLAGQATDGAPLLRQVADRLRTAERFHFETVTETELTSERHRSWQRGTEVLAKDGPSRLRYELMDSTGSYVAVNDGTTLWRAAPDTREFMRGPATDTKGGGPIGQMALRRSELALKYMASRLTDQLVRAEEKGAESVEVGGRSVECVVVHGEYAPRGGSIGIDKWTQTFWIDRERLIVLKSENISSGHQSPDRPFEETMIRHLTRYRVATINEPVAPALFTYSPPATYREMDRLERAYPRPSKELIGTTAPDLTLPTLTGETMNLQDLRGKVVLLDFWATWCIPCRAQMAKLAQQKLTGVVLLGVNDDETPEKARQFMTENNYPWPILFDGKSGEARRKFKVTSIPTLVLIDKDGKIVAYEVGAADSADVAIAAALRKLGL
jgi:cytochrome c biogenesis protein CcmG/thiol:disulfide interchange protein DsbE